MCFEGININYVSSKNIINDLKRDDPNLETLLERARSDDGDALFAGSLVLLGGFDLAPIDEVEATEWTRRGAVAKHPACAVALWTSSAFWVCTGESTRSRSVCCRREEMAARCNERP